MGADSNTIPLGTRDQWNSRKSPERFTWSMIFPAPFGLTPKLTNLRGNRGLFCGYSQSQGSGNPSWAISNGNPHRLNRRRWMYKRFSGPANAGRAQDKLVEDRTIPESKTRCVTGSDKQYENQESGEP